MDSRCRDLQVAVLDGHRLLDHVGERAGGLDAGRAAPDNDEVERAAVDQRGVAVGVLEHGDDARAKPLRVMQRIERERVDLGAGRPEEVRLRSRRQHDCVAGPGSAVGRGDGAGRRVDRRHLRQLHVDVGVVAKDRAQRERHVGRGQLRGRDLVEEGLELVVVVAVEQRDAHVACFASRLAHPSPANPPPTTITWGLSGHAMLTPGGSRDDRRPATRSPSP